MSIEKARLKKITAKLKPIGLSDVLPFGKYKGCRVGFVINMDAKYLEKALTNKIFFVNKAVVRELKAKLDWIQWSEYLLK